MFTQCSKCETVFRLSAESLRAAGGQVRCGRCGEVFNALARLAEDAGGFEHGESPLELESRADEILQSAEAVAPANASLPPNGAEIAHLQISAPLDDDSPARESLEFTLPPGELDRIFIETTPNLLEWLNANVPEGSPTAAAPDAPAAPAAPAAADAPASPHARPHPDAANTPHSGAARPHAGAPPAPSAVQPIKGFDVSEDVVRAMRASFQAELPQILVPRRQLPSFAWAAAAGFLALLLAAQILIANGSWVSAQISGNAQVQSKLSAYELRQWGVSEGPAAKGTLRVRASILNVAARMEPYPLLRVSLADRFGTRIAEGAFDASEYLGKTTAQALAPGERVEAVMDVKDPGTEAEGFEIDVCLRDAEKSIVCAADAAAARSAGARADPKRGVAAAP